MINSINESDITQADAKALFNKAADLRNNPGIMGRVPFFKKKSIDVNDLQQAWKNEGFPLDVRDIVLILKEFGFGDGEIKKVMAGIFGDSEDDEEGYSTPGASDAIMKLVNYAKKAGIDKDIIAFMKKEYPQMCRESYEHIGNIVIEDVRKIFTAIVDEKRSALPELVKNEEYKSLGRNRK